MEKKLLIDVCYIRLILIIFLVLYHAFAIFCGGWTPIVGYPDIPSYYWVGMFSCSFMLEAFVFISGLIYGYQIKRKPELMSFRNVIINKTKRLLLPSCIFSLIYYLIFFDLNESIYKIAYTILCGTGHMWFLPMLFWCFIITAIVEKSGIQQKYIIIISLLLAMMSPLPLPLRLSSAMYYFFFFYTGYLVNKNDLDIHKFITKRNVLLVFSVYVILFVGLTTYVKSLGGVISLSNIEIINKIIYYGFKTFSKFIIAFCGVLTIFLLINYVLLHIETFSETMIKASGLCFGIYIYQQFILKYLYYYTELPNQLSPYLLPWIGFIVALFLSFLLSYATHKTKLGKFLIG